MTNKFKLYDQFELRNQGVNSAHVYDFSQSSANPTVASGQTNWIIKDKPAQPGNMITFVGDTGTRNIVFGDPETLNFYGPVFNGTTVGGGLAVNASLTSPFTLLPDNGNEKTLPFISNNTSVQFGTRIYNPTPTPGYAAFTLSPSVPFRSGYYEFSFKTNAQNTIIASGNGTTTSPVYEQISSSSYVADENNSGTSTTTISIKNGKINLNFQDLYGNNATSFDITGTTNVADDVWHHVVINITRPGLEKFDARYTDERSIEIWVDAKLDKKDSNYINNNQVFFNTITTLFGNYEFTGLFRTFAQRINYPLTREEIEERYSLWNYHENSSRKSISLGSLTATIKEPTVSVNKKRALKLFWTGIENKNGIELENNYIVNSYSVTNVNANSSTETYNQDLANKKQFNLLTNVRIALAENVLIPAPGAIQITDPTTAQINPNNISTNTVAFTGSLSNITFSGVELENADRILLTNQIDSTENGIWQYNGKTSPLTRPADVNSVQKISNGLVYVAEGYQAETHWILESAPNSFTEPQKWIKLNEKPSGSIYSQPFLESKWTDVKGNERFIDLENDVNILQYDLIVFMNYPETFDEIRNNFPNDGQVKAKYDNFIKSLRNVVAQGASLYISSPLLAADLGVIRNYSLVDQKVEAIDAQSAAINPFEPSEASDQYFDTHRINMYNLATPVAGLTNKATYILTDFINYVPTDINKQEQYHAKYAYKPLGILEGNEFYIPSLALREITENQNIPGNRSNSKGTKPLTVIKPADILTGTVVTKLQNTYYNGTSTLTNNDDDDATTIIVHNSQVLKGQPVLGKIFVNFVEDGYTMSRKDYNKAVIQVLPTPDTNETTTTRGWQYSTKRLNRSPQRINVRELTEFGQTTPTNGGGGPLIQAPTNASNGIIRSQTDSGNIDYQSDLYTTEAEEIYTLQEIPVLSMTYLGLQWLAE
jgi:hypothetical protein